MLARENQFKQIYKTAYNRSLEVNSKAHQNRKKHKLGKLLDVGQLVLMENHSFEDGKSKKLHELRSGPYEETKKLTNVNYEIELVSNKTVKKVAHRNHLIEYFPIENAISELVVDYGLRNENFQPFYKNLMNKQVEKLNRPVDKFSFQQSFTETEFFPVDNFTSNTDNIQNENNHEKTLEDNNTTITKTDSGFQEGFSTTFVDNTQTPDNRSHSRTRSSTPYPETRIRFADPPDIRVSPVRTQTREQSTEANPTPSDDQRSSRIHRRISGRLKKLSTRYQAGFT